MARTMTLKALNHLLTITPPKNMPDYFKVSIDNCRSWKTLDQIGTFCITKDGRLEGEKGKMYIKFADTPDLAWLSDDHQIVVDIDFKKLVW